MFPKFLLLAVLSFLFPLKSIAQIYADVQVAGAVSGTFTITLEHAKTPGAVANFIGLATGQRGWLDATSGAIRYDPFYNGVTFHRVIANFMSQTGSRNGLGTDGPGYTFRDEIDATLPHVNYAVAMANSGKNTNGSQFYVCKGAQTFLNGNYTVFGLVTAGQSVCDAINATPTTGAGGSPADRPLTPITIQSVSIYGPSLAAFNRDPAWLPKILSANPIPKRNGAAFTLGFDRRTYSSLFLYTSANLTTWTKLAESYLSNVIPPSSDIDYNVTLTGQPQFYRIARVDYSACALSGTGGRTFRFSNPLGGTAALIAGTWTFDGSAPIGLTATYNPSPYAAQLHCQLGNGMEFLLNLSHSTTTAGTYTGQTNVMGFENVSGTFTVAP